MLNKPVSYRFEQNAMKSSAQILLPYFHYKIPTNY